MIPMAHPVLVFLDMFISHQNHHTHPPPLSTLLIVSSLACAISNHRNRRKLLKWDREKQKAAESFPRAQDWRAASFSLWSLSAQIEKGLQHGCLMFGI